MKKVILVGGASFIGLNLIEKFLSDSYRIFVYGRTEPSIISENLIFIKGELHEISEKLAFLSPEEIHDAIYLVNTVPVNGSLDNYKQEIANNKAALTSLFIIVERVIFFSSGGRVYKDSKNPHHEIDELGPICPYGKSKVELEEFIKLESMRLGKQFLIVRPANPYGKHQNIKGTQGLIAVLLGRIKNSNSIEVWGTGNEVRDYIYIDDFVNLFIQLLEANDLPFSIYNIGSGGGLSTLDIIKVIDGELSGRCDYVINYIKPPSPLIESNILDVSRLTSVVTEHKKTSLRDGIRHLISELEL
ncbi:NAD-dependent epimerase/dehydratase family protein [Pseudoalteromonas sp. SG43-6]|uniref:NAD-dependent epimerase/dehydratase family protein n=1 Tax=Pseudoalteromonas sp. SG43-6 TaxID=2760967 RepID=UPI001601379F|nr:NAD-dependent epimerase/dehydratase family protein [Pseudoalteromonas sp. SG43-6]MBB1436640.1 NAD-dependent epimerase/dehydratase family protein [Pseudoalteromonas sp. SG43-6]